MVLESSTCQRRYWPWIWSATIDTIPLNLWVTVPLLGLEDADIGSGIPAILALSSHSQWDVNSNLRFGTKLPTWLPLAPGPRQSQTEWRLCCTPFFCFTWTSVEQLSPKKLCFYTSCSHVQWKARHTTPFVLREVRRQWSRQGCQD